MRVFDYTAPADDDKEGLGAEELRDAKVDFYDRFSLDHNFNGTVTTVNPECDGYHKRVTLADFGTDPSLMAGAGRVYTKTAGSNVELFYINNNGTVIQITSGDSLAVRLSYNSSCLYTTPQAYSGSGDVLMKFSVRAFDVLMEYGTVSGKFTATKSGGYLIMVNCAQAATITLKVSGSTISSVAVLAGGQASFSQALSAGQYVEIYSDAEIGASSTFNIGRLY